MKTLIKSARILAALGLFGLVAGAAQAAESLGSTDYYRALKAQTPASGGVESTVPTAGSLGSTDSYRALKAQTLASAGVQSDRLPSPSTQADTTDHARGII